MNNPTASLLAICRRLLDPDAQAVVLHPGHNGTAVLRAKTAAGEVIVKVHRSPERHRQEVDAYQHWAPVLRGRAPQLLAVNDDPPAIVVTALNGHSLASICLNPSQEVEAHRQAGKVLRLLHHAAPPRTQPEMTAWLAGRGEQWLTLAEDILSTTRRREIRTHLRALTQLGPTTALPCHLDYTPRNLVWAATIRLSVIDFEHARYDLPARDLVRLATRTWPTRPDIEEAFLDGYGELSDLDRQIIEHCSHIDALTAAVRAAGIDPAVGTTSRRPSWSLEIAGTVSADVPGIP
jgi:Ser/Thr protein kinase RdoA (MazF antagonist)